MKDRHINVDPFLNCTTVGDIISLKCFNENLEKDELDIASEDFYRAIQFDLIELEKRRIGKPLNMDAEDKDYEVMRILNKSELASIREKIISLDIMKQKYLK